MTPDEKLAYWLSQPPSQERDYWIAAMNRIIPGNNAVLADRGSS